MEELTKKQEDFVLEQEREKIKCQFCGKNEGTETIIDGETQKEILICEECDNMMEWED